MTNDTCSNCNFFDGDISNCHRYPPTVLVDNEDIFNAYPEVDSLEWCGEYVFNEKLSKE